MPLAVVNTNVSQGAIPKDFMEKFLNFIVRVLGCEQKFTMIEVHPNCLMMRAGSASPMVNVMFHHNDDHITEDTKRETAARFAQFITSELRVPIDRILVLFIDTRCTTRQQTYL
ncbi:DgyrCDS1319 [Dimorphilus gyrociliatus]|uniref:L-dopachrome isomerase n=1 Tax=Dimorphilus gyrociliatus TaxID=2664684 RepID=A0A7I8V6X1_9ANNE|nr:DgyrCDS1319 [Dimorphilus gyrociliatus]